MLIAFLSAYEFTKGIHSGGLVFFFWVLQLILNIVPFRSLILNIRYDDQVLLFSFPCHIVVKSSFTSVVYRGSLVGGW